MDKLTEHQEKILKKIKSARLIDYDNILDWINLTKIGKGKNKGKYWLFVSLNVNDLKLKDLGYTDDWSRKNPQVIEQFQILVTKKQLTQFKNTLALRLGTENGKNN